MKLAEAARVLCNPPEKVARDWNRLRAKLRNRVRMVVKGKNLDNRLRRKKGSSKRATNREAANGGDFENLPFFGMWADRDEMNDSVDWVRREREKWQQRLTQQR